MKQKRFNAKNRKEKGRRIAEKDTTDIPPEQQPPMFSLQYMNKDYSLSQCTKDEKAAFADTIAKLSQLTWSEIKSQPRHGLGYEKISREAIRSSIPGQITDDVNFIAFRFCGKAPMVGYRDRSVFYIIWFDRNFTLYPH
ncbi:MAG: hypothetical protein GDA48_08100 [Hormoscilla sp. GM102CHS1]|nr:hypothetical protein [Hormoscilla sp. GM102CHS1]